MLKEYIYSRQQLTFQPTLLALAALLFLFFTISAKAEPILTTQWQEVATGIAYTHKINSKNNRLGYIHIFKINLQKNALELAFAQDDLFPAEMVKWLAKKNQALLAVNGGFFTSSWKPIGLRIQNGRMRSPLQPTRWWHVFYLKKNIPYITPEKDYHPDPDITLAVQGGPRLLMNGQIPHLKPGKAERTAIGITRHGEIILLATENWPFATADLARIFQAPESQGGLDCIQALNLDGGSSTQLYANIGKLQLDISSLALITDILYVTAR